MKILGLVTEYNPFHFGHKYHLEKSMELTSSTHSIAVMSSSFVQRGEPSLIDKWSKAKMAIDNGVDLVIELPFVYSSQSAEYFAHGAVNILNQINVVDYMSFGTEIDEIKILEELAKLFLEEPMLFKNNLKYFLSLGYSFSVSRSKAVEEYYILEENKDIYSNVLKGSNNILAIEYLKALYRLESKIKPIAIERIGSNYKDLGVLEGYASATGIRNKIFQNGLSSVEDLLPEHSFTILKEYQNKFKNFNRIENYEKIFNYLLRIKDVESKIQLLLHIENGLENRIIKTGKTSLSIKEIIENTSTKRYPLTKVQRLFIHLLNNMDGKTILKLYNNEPQYIRVLGSNKKGFEILNKIKHSSDINIISKYADYKSLNNKIINEFLLFEEQATDLFFLGLHLEKPLVDLDYITTPYYLKEKKS